MSTEKSSASSGGGALPFILGVIVALGLGWGVYPQILYSAKTAPVEFDHEAHVKKVGMDCVDCHGFRADGSFVGIPPTQSCAECHNEPTKKNANLDKIVTEYVKKGKEIPWVQAYYQPDNVFFSHKAHEAWACTDCHADVSNKKKSTVAVKNRLTGYSKETTQTMKMWQCERCHAETGASNGCYVCHW
jgi:menaquinone reductase, multiheme cytochrome c subunit